MKIEVSKDVLVPLLDRCRSVADPKSAMPVLGKCLLTANGSLRIDATDLFQAVSGSVQADVKEKGAIAVSAKDLLERVKMLSGIVSLSTKGSDVIIKSGSRRFTMHGIPAEEFPELPRNDSPPMLTLAADTLARLINCVYFAVSTDASRQHLNSALFEHADNVLRMVATDGHRLSLAETPAPEGCPVFSMLIPLKGLLEIRSLLSAGGQVDITQHGPNLFLRIGGFSFSLKTVDAQFPPWKNVLPSGAASVATVERAAMADAVKAVAVAASTANSLIRLTFAAGKLRVQGESPDAGDGFDELDITCDGSVTLGMNSAYLLSALGAIDSEQVTVKLNGDLDPIVVQPVTESAMRTVQLVMPARVG